MWDKAPPCPSERSSDGLEEGVRRGASLAGPAVEYPIKCFSLRPGSWMTYELAKDRMGNPSQTYSSTGWNRLSGREKAASGNLQGLAGRRCRLARRHRATVLAAAPAARGKPGIRIRREHQRADRRKAEQSHQQHRDTSEHWDYYTPHPAKPYLRERKLRLSSGPPCASKNTRRFATSGPSQVRQKTTQLSETKTGTDAFNTTKWTTQEVLPNGA